MRKFIALVAVAALFYVPARSAEAAEKPTIILVHGAFEDASVWSDVASRLQKKGYKTQAVNLPGRTSTPLPAAQVTQDVLRDAVVKVILSETAPVVLVGHSFGGITISTVAEAVPDRIAKLVYVAAYLPKNGESLLSLSSADKDSKLGPFFKVDGASGVARIDENGRIETFCHDCPDAIKTTFPATMVDEPLNPPGTPVKLTAQNFGSVKKAYIKTALDRVVSPALQQNMLEATPVSKVLTIDSGHTPFLSRPQELADAIAQIASE
jgi:pimeloyl-ACP methyl ester carboxylesterase